MNYAEVFTFQETKKVVLINFKLFKNRETLMKEFLKTKIDALIIMHWLKILRFKNSHLWKIDQVKIERIPSKKQTKKTLNFCSSVI